jgi:hypothetical protein
MVNSVTTGPLAGLSGGFIPQLCPPPTAAQAAALAKSQPGSAAAAAAAIKASEADAKARVAAIEYLGTVDCSRWPEAQKALINGLLEDPNECVRFAAAKALNSGCCCDKKVIEALRVCVSGEATNAPPETSPRVKAAAFSALQNCLMRVPEDLPVEKGPGPERTVPEAAPLPGPERTTRNGNAAENPHIAASYNAPQHTRRTFEDQVQRKTLGQTVDEARRTLFELSRTPRQPNVLPTGRRSLFGALAKARQDASANQLRRAREKGLVPPAPDQADPRLDPTESSPANEPGSIDPLSTPSAGPSDGESSSDSGSMSNAAPARNASRGLIGMMIPSRAN